MRRFLIVFLTALVILGIFAIICGIVAGVGVAIGFGLAAIVPRLDLGSAIVAGSIVSVAGWYFMLRLLASLPEQSGDDEAVGEIDEDRIIILSRNFLRSSPKRRKPRKRP